MNRQDFLIAAGGLAALSGCASQSGSLLGLPTQSGSRKLTSVAVSGNSSNLYSNSSGHLLASATYYDSANSFVITTPPNGYHPNGGTFTYDITNARHMVVGDPQITLSS
jgi:hypothetical protein